MPLDRRAERLLAMLAAGASGGPSPSPDGRRQTLIDLARVADDPTAPALANEATATGPGGPLPLRIYSPQGAGAARLPGLVFFHGGGWTAGGFETHEGLCGRICAASGFRIVAVDYRLAPEHPFPAALDDGLAALAAVARQAERFGIDPGRLGVGGDSAGGALAASVARLALKARGPAVALQVLICPILDPGASAGSRKAFGEGYFVDKAAFDRDLADYLPAGADLADFRLSPLRAASFAGLPPAIVHTAEFDPFRDEGESYVRALAEAGVPVRAERHAGMIHYFYALAAAIPHAREAALAIGAQMRSMVGPPAQ
ncbi:MAG: alpha/beta hydrolase [Caulobacteraceae bacterium]